MVAAFLDDISERLLKDESGQLKGATVRDEMTGNQWNVAAKAVINATGCFCDAIRYGFTILRKLSFRRNYAEFCILD